MIEKQMQVIRNKTDYLEHSMSQSDYYGAPRKEEDDNESESLGIQLNQTIQDGSMTSLLSDLNVTKKESEQMGKQPSTDEIYKEDFYPVEELPEEEKPSQKEEIEIDKV